MLKAIRMELEFEIQTSWRVCFEESMPTSLQKDQVETQFLSVRFLSVDASSSLHTLLIVN